MAVLSVVSTGRSPYPAAHKNARLRGLWVRLAAALRAQGHIRVGKIAATHQEHHLRTGQHEHGRFGNAGHAVVRRRGREARAPRPSPPRPDRGFWKPRSSWPLQARKPLIIAQPVAPCPARSQEIVIAPGPARQRFCAGSGPQGAARLSARPTLTYGPLFAWACRAWAREHAPIRGHATRARNSCRTPSRPTPQKCLCTRPEGSKITLAGR